MILATFYDLYVLASIEIKSVFIVKQHAEFNTVLDIQLLGSAYILHVYRTTIIHKCESLYTHVFMFVTLSHSNG